MIVVECVAEPLFCEASFSHVMGYVIIGGCPWLVHRMGFILGKLNVVHVMQLAASLLLTGNNHVVIADLMVCLHRTRHFNLAKALEIAVGAVVLPRPGSP